MRGGSVILLGQLLAHPELSFTPTGEAVASFQLITSPPGLAATDVPSQRCLAWNQGGRQLAELVLEHLHAGDVVYLEGRLQAPPQGGPGNAQTRSPNVLVWDLQLLEPRRRGSRPVSGRGGLPGKEEAP